MTARKPHTVSLPKLLSTVTCCLLAFSANRALGAAWPERVGTAEVRPGEVTRGRLPLIEYADGSDVEAPVIVIAGRTAGRSFGSCHAGMGTSSEVPSLCSASRRLSILQP